MASFFPPPYPDELLYSVIARYHVRSGSTSPKSTIGDVFSSRTATAVTDMPCNIKELYCNLPEVSKIEPERLIMDYTLYPYYTAFLQQARASLILKAMKSNYGGNIHTRTGIMASSISVPDFLRFCTECNNYDLTVYGEYYWHRIHQIPGIFVCPVHNIFLQDSTVAVHAMNKHVFVAANEYNCISKPQLNSCCEQQERFFTIAQDVEWLIQNYRVVRNSKGLKNGFRDKYISVLKEKGFATAKGRVHQEDFIKAFRDFNGDVLLSKLNCNVTYDFESNWLSTIVRKHRKAFHPLMHLLLIRFLMGDLEDFFQNDYKFSPFGRGPWPCMNAVSGHYRRFVIRDLKVDYSTDMKKPVGTFTCSCGFIYTRSGPDGSDKDIYKIGRVKQYGSVWEDKLKELVAINNMGLREISRILNVDTNTVKRYAELMNLKSAWAVNKDNASIKPQNGVLKLKNDSYRERWLELKNKYPKDSKTQLRNKEKGTYIWLYRKDRNWLNNNSPATTRGTYDNTRVNWSQRDTDILKKVRQVVQETLVSIEKPERITVGYVGKKIRQLALLEKHLDKMPKTKEYLRTSIETVEQFQIRQIKWCADQLRKNGDEIKEWKLVRMAGIRSGYSGKIRSTIKKEINKFNNKAEGISDA